MTELVNYFEFAHVTILFAALLFMLTVLYWHLVDYIDPPTNREELLKAMLLAMYEPIPVNREPDSGFMDTT